MTHRKCQKWALKALKNDSIKSWKLVLIEVKSKVKVKLNEKCIMLSYWFLHFQNQMVAICVFITLALIGMSILRWECLYVLLTKHTCIAWPYTWSVRLYLSCFKVHDQIDEG